MNALSRNCRVQISRVARRAGRVGFLLAFLAAEGLAEGHGGGGHGGYHSEGGWIHPSMGVDHSQLQPGGFPTIGHPGHGQPTVINYNPGIYLGYGVGGIYAYSPSFFFGGGGGFGGGFGPTFGPTFPQFPIPNAMGPAGGGLMLPAPPRGLVNPNANPNPARVRRISPARAKELVDIGDRSFRVHNIKRAEEKFLLAVKADPTAPAPHVHLAQVSMARGDYSAAADHLRDAVSVAPEGAWLVNAPDIQAIFGEPADFARQLARLETHLQVSPNDRDAWFVLGAESYLSGRTRQASDAFQRLTDRRPDQALAAFLDASRPQPAAAN